MIEVKLTNVNFGVYPIPGEPDAKQISFYHNPTQTAYLAPFSKEALEVLIEQLQMTSEQLESHIEKKRLEQELAITPEERQAIQGNGIVLPGE